jgi:hypothetical protein
LTDQDQHSNSIVREQMSESPPAGRDVRKKFVEPEISQAVDVLEATTFFAAVDSGQTGKSHPD